MNKKIQLVYELLSDMPVLESNKILDNDEITYLLSSKLSHRLSKNFLGRMYLRHYYAPMIVSAFDQLRKGDFLELGCGTGTQVIYAKKMKFNVATGIDLFQNRISIAQKRATFYEVNEGTTFEAIDFWKFYPDKRYNAVYSMFAFELFGSPVAQATNQLTALCAEQATIVLDMGRITYLRKQRYFTSLIENLSKQGFKVNLEPLFPFVIDSSYAKVLGKYNIWPYFRAVRLIANRL